MPSLPAKQFRVIALLFAAGSCVFSASLDSSQQQRAQHLYQLFTAPCCWRQCVAEHQSPEAAEVRNKIDTYVAEGKTDAQVKAALIKEYGKAILLVPEGLDGFIVFAVPVAITVTALLALLFALRKCKRSAISVPESTDILPGDWWERVEREFELRRFGK